MTPDDAFLHDIIEHPDDDAPRLIYADWLDEHGQADRAEFIRLQCRLAALPPDDPGIKEMHSRELQLLRSHQDQWVGDLKRVVISFLFARGFVSWVAVSAPKFVEHGDWLFAQAPIRTVQMSDLARCIHKLVQ
jgi:uncharacterized protein (TIGR02996 family)